MLYQIKDKDKIVKVIEQLSLVNRNLLRSKNKKSLDVQDNIIMLIIKLILIYHNNMLNYHLETPLKLNIKKKVKAKWLLGINKKLLWEIEH